MEKNVHLAVFASGSGTNAENIIKYFSDHRFIRVVRVYCNNPQAYVIQRVKPYGVPVTLFDKEEFVENGQVYQKLKEEHTDYIILAGFLWKIPDFLIRTFPGRILNIHPALLPKYCGKGMYGERVHQAVIAAGDTESGISIHRVDEMYDHGEIIFQAKCPVLPQDTPETLAARIHQLEYEYYPKIIEKVIISDEEKQAAF
ncbi:MAG TPA: phosphoribosylglycinamide formyltransferase [Bacteroidales bacterium]|jgi:phosphoribosylglycinamide formyltransferase-1|nr:phosphoribosylglycinamide formyltransferase [Bacteroidales bacterium]HQQ02666.1 phosphoribosylglycinamide formyltransferase [Bacteroidales bacterium]